jgi:hypothetical protein
MKELLHKPLFELYFFKRNLFIRLGKFSQNSGKKKE